MRLLAWALALTVFGGWPSSCAAQDPVQRVLALSESGAAVDGKGARYTLEALGADVRDVLAVLLRKAGEEFSIDQDVTGPVSIIVRDKSLDEILSRVLELAKPALKLNRGKYTTVAVAPAAPASRARATRVEPTYDVGGALSQVLTVPGGMQNNIASQTAALGQPVTLSIPDAQPIPFYDAMKRIEAQAGISIMVDARVPADLGFASQFTRTPLSLVLESISRTGALKWYTTSNGILIAPTDWLHLALGKSVISGFPAQPCSKCGKPMPSSWSFCPFDGTPIARRNTIQNRRGQGR